MRKVFKKTESLIAIFIICVFVILPFQNVLASGIMESSQSFQVKLISAEYYPQLERLSKNIRARFTRSKTDEFQNIYSFESTYSLKILRTYLAGCRQRPRFYPKS